MLPIQKFKNIVGDAFVFTDVSTIHRYSRATLPEGTTPAAVVKPKNRSEVTRIINTAKETHVALYPVSRGCNWGYGSACAVGDGQVILDLSRMNRIIHVDETLAYAVIEPGVTQIQLVSYLKENNIPLWLDCSGSGPEASVLGNTMERGFGHTPYGDHFLHSCGMEVVLGDGRTLKTGYGHYDNAQSTYVFKYGIGPYMDGLFTQSNFGVVTRLGIWLMPAPECLNMFYCTVPRDQDLAAVVDALRPLKLSGQIQSLIHIGNDLRVFSSFNQYPWKKAGNKTPLTDDLRNQFCKRGGFGAWNVSGAIYGSRGQVRMTRKALKEALKPLGQIRFVGDRTLSLLNCLSGLLDRFPMFPELKTKLKSVDKVFGLLKGEPTDAFLFGTLWRVKTEVKPGSIADPLDFNAGMMWIAPIMPMTGQTAERLIQLVNPVFEKYGFEPLITVSLITERAMVSVITIAYDKDDPGECKQAQACYDAFFSLIMSQGYVPYRTNIHTMKKLAEGSETFWEVTKEIKTILDPEGIIAPGRYQPFDKV